MQNVAKHTGLLVKSGKEMSQGLFDFGLAFTMLGQVGPGTQFLCSNQDKSFLLVSSCSRCW